MTPFNLSEAKRQCSDDPSCTMFFDGLGDDGWKYFCVDGAEIIEDDISILYIKRSEYIFISTSFCNASNYNVVKLLIIIYNTHMSLCTNMLMVY